MLPPLDIVPFIEIILYLVCCIVNEKILIFLKRPTEALIPICIQDGDRGGSEEPTQAYRAVRRGEQRSDNEGIRLKANWYHLAINFLTVSAMVEQRRPPPTRSSTMPKRREVNATSPVAEPAETYTSLMNSTPKTISIIANVNMTPHRNQKSALGIVSFLKTCPTSKSALPLPVSAMRDRSRLLA